ncbi:MAG: BlaI/MecI/CopY family transcriptional regulator [Terriglobales bacterium]
MAEPASSRPVAHLGPLESGVMEILWERGACNVRAVAAALPRPLAYTTVMTTLDRLYKKGLLVRRKQNRAFIYAARESRAHWLQCRAREFVASFFADPAPARSALVSCLLEEFEQYDQALLEDLGRRLNARLRAAEGPSKKGGA